MTTAELRITDAEMAAIGRRGTIVCPACCGTDDDCPECDGLGVWFTHILPRGASARIGAILLARLPHLRGAVWPPKPRRVDRHALALAIGMAAAVL